tara:strand:+ start:583 stop:1326 length:744 start_codon:yes stop_codon:yes gene_type:complete
MLTVVAHAELLTPEQELELSKRLAQWRRQPLSPEELAELLPKVSDPVLALAIGERLGMAGPQAFALIGPLCEQLGLRSALVRALSICHHPDAKQQLLEWLPQAGELEPEVLRALGCWGNGIDLSIITNALNAPGQQHRLAGIELLTFRCRRISTEQLLSLCEPLLEDLRADVVIATLRLLQRRDEPQILQRIAACATVDALPGVAEMAIQALGCIQNESSLQLLQQLIEPLQETRLEEALKRQLEAQ